MNNQLKTVFGKIRDKKNIICMIAACIFALFSVGTVLYYIIYPSAAFLHSDCTDTILWAKASVDSHKLFNPDFGYAALLPFGGTTIMMPLVAIFGYTLTAHQCGMILFTFFALFSVWFLCQSFDFSTPFSLFTIGAISLTLALSGKLREIFYEHTIYYSFSVAAICILLGLVMRISESKGNRIAGLAVLAVFSALCALDGIQVISTSIFPVIFGAVMFILLENKKIFSAENKNLLFAVGFTAVGTVVGFTVLTVLTRNITAGYADAYSTYSDMAEWIKNFAKLPSEWFKLFGVTIVKGEKIFTFISIVDIIRIAAAIVIGICPFAGLLLYKKLGKGAKILTFTHFGLAGVIMFGYIFGILSAANWRLSPLIGTGFLTCAVLLNDIKTGFVPKRAAALFCALFIAVSSVSAVGIIKMPANGIKENQRYAITNLLISQGLHRGYATFWNSQVISLLSNEKLEVANVDINDKGIAPCLYQTDNKMFKENGEEKYFLLISYDEEAKLSQTDDFVKVSSNVKDVIPTNLGYDILIFNSLDFLY